MSFADSPSLVVDRQIASQYGVAGVCLAVAASIPWWLPFELETRIIIAFAFSAITALAAWRAGLFGARYCVTQAIWDSAGQWHLVDASGSRQIAELASATCVWRSLIWLHWKSDGGRRQLLLLRSWRQGGGASSQRWRPLAARLRLRSA